MGDMPLAPPVESEEFGAGQEEYCLRRTRCAPSPGGDTPPADLAEVARRRDVEMIAVSASSVSVETEALRRQAEVLGSA